MKMTDLRAFSGAAVFYYDTNGTLVEDLREDFKEYCESTISPVPMTMSAAPEAAFGSPAVTTLSDVRQQSSEATCMT